LIISSREDDETYERQLRRVPHEISGCLRRLPISDHHPHREARVLDANRACLDLFGYEREEIIGLDAALLFWGGSEELHRFQDDIERHGSVKDYDIQIQRKDGKQIDCVVAATTWWDKDGLRGYTATVRDATDQKKTERSLRSLLRMSDGLNGASNLDDLLDLLVQQLLELLDAESGCAGLRNSQGMSCGHCFLGPTIVPMIFECIPGTGWAGWLIERGTYYLNNDAEHDPLVISEVRDRFAVKSGLAVPILDSEKDVIAFFEVHNKRSGGGFTSADLNHGLAAAQIGSLAIHNRLLHKNLSALVAFSSSLTVTSEFDQVLEVIGRHIDANFKQRSVIFLPANGALIPYFRSVEFPLDGAELAAADWSWKHGQEAGRSTEILSHAQCHYLPLKARGEVIGALGLEARPKSWLSNVQRQLLSTFVNQFGLAIERGLLEQKVRRLRFLEESDKVQNAVLSSRPKTISHSGRDGVVPFWQNTFLSNGELAEFGL